MLKRFRKGAGEFIGYSISILFLTIFYIIILNSLILNNAENVMEECILSVGRQVVICDSWSSYNRDKLEKPRKYKGLH